MSFLRKTQMLLLTCLIVWAAAISCKPVDTQMAREKPQSGNLEAHTEMGKKTLSKKEITAAANAALRRHGYDPRTLGVFYDEGNAFWTRTIRSNPALADHLKSRLDGRDYQFLEYGEEPPRPGWVLWVIIDRNTGEELWFVKQG